MTGHHTLLSGELSGELSDEDRLLAVDEQGAMMAIRCAKCGVRRDRKEFQGSPSIAITIKRGGVLAEPKVTLRGILTCKHDGHRWPVVIDEGDYSDVSPGMPIAVSGGLHSTVPAGIAEDVREAEDAHFHGLFKAAVVLCRRSLQLALENKMPGLPATTKWTLGSLITEAQSRTPPLLTPNSHSLAIGIKDYGDAGAHREEAIPAEAVRMVLVVTGQVLNELFP